MKFKTILAGVALVLGSTFTPLVLAADASAPAASSDAMPSGKPHSHVQDKLGYVPSSTQGANSRKAANPNPWTDKTRHFHPRDK